MTTARKLALITIGHKRCYELDSDPSINGFDAPIGSEAFVRIGDNGKLFFKDGASLTAWKELLSKSAAASIEGAIDIKNFTLAGPVIQTDSIDSHRTILSDCVLNMIGASLRISGDAGFTTLKINGYGINGSVSSTITLNANSAVSSLIVPLNIPIGFTAGDIVWVEVVDTASGQVEDLCVDLLFGSPTIIDNTGMLALYHFNNNLLDSSGNNYNPETISSSWYQFEQGRFGSGIQMNLESSKIPIKNLLGQIGSGDFTIEMQVKYDPTILSASKYFSYFAIGEYSLGLQYGTIVVSNGGGQLYVQFPESLLDGSFHHLAFVRKNNVGYLYSDGILIASTGPGGANSNFISTDVLNLFGHTNNTSDRGNTIFDEVKVSNKAMYSENFTPPYKQF